MKPWLLCLFGIVGTILLGALGSGLWEKAVKPLFEWSGRLMLRTSFGLFQFSRNRMYSEAARGRRDRGALFLIKVLSGAALFFAVWYGSESYSLRTANSQRTEFARILEKSPPGEIAKTLEQEVLRLRSKLALTLIVISLYLFVGFGLSYLRLSYIESVIAFFDQCCHICRPSFESGEETELRSRFARMQCKQEFLDIQKKLREIAVRSGAILPRFTPL